ncbi:MAG: carboxypeptidase regulatory-like domain-containing protein, partial [Bryobacterales bacterium]|nr:carboxypeptidase regulatory-like domain-containing protein [Bryobacterales bacterium]
MLSPRWLPALLLSAALLPAQTSTGQIAGTVFDQSGAVIPSAQVRLLGADTGDVTRSLTTGADGTFAAPLLRPSTYTVEASATG